MEKFLKYFFVIAFAGLLCVVPIFTLLDIKTMDDSTFEKIESRTKAQLSEWGYSSEVMEKYFRNLENFINDRFAFRNDFLYLHARMCMFVGWSPLPDQVLLGKDNWMFLNDASQNLIKQFQGKLPLTSHEIQKWKAYFAKTQDYLLSRNIEFYIVVAPDKHSIYPEFLPLYVSKKGFTPYDQIREAADGLNIIDLHQPLLSKKTQTDKILYHKTDAHWNNFGAYIAYSEISSKIKAQWYKPVVMDDSEFVMKECRYETGLQRLIRLPKFYPDQLVNNTASISKYDKVLLCKNLKFKNTKLLDRGTKIQVRKEQIVLNKSKHGRALLIGDSFLGILSPYFNSSIGLIKYKYSLSPIHENLEDLINQYQPDFVIWEMAERLLKSPVADCFAWKNQNNLNTFSCLSQDSVFKFSKFEYYIENVDNKDDGISLLSTGNDPIIYLPPYKYPSDPFVVEIEMSSSISGRAELFYLTDDITNYSVEFRVSSLVTPGRQTLWFEIHDFGVKGKLRFDPIDKPGKITIHSIRMCIPDL